MFLFGRGAPKKFCTLLRFCTIYKMSLQENIEKKIFVPPPESLRGGHFCCPPLNCSGGGQFSVGGTVPPLKLLRGGLSPCPPPCIRSCMYIFGLRVGVKSRKDRREAVVSLCENCTNSMNTASFSM